MCAVKGVVMGMSAMPPAGSRVEGRLAKAPSGIRGLQTVASRVHFREQYRALVGHALVRARVLLLLLLLRALSVLGDTV